MSLGQRPSPLLSNNAGRRNGRGILRFFRVRRLGPTFGQIAGLYAVPRGLRFRHWLRSRLEVCARCPGG